MAPWRACAGQRRIWPMGNAASPSHCDTRQPAVIATRTDLDFPYTGSRGSGGRRRADRLRKRRKKTGTIDTATTWERWKIAGLSSSRGFLRCVWSPARGLRTWKKQTRSLKKLSSSHFRFTLPTLQSETTVTATVPISRQVHVICTHSCLPQQGQRAQIRCSRALGRMYWLDPREYTYVPKHKCVPM